MRNDKIIPGVVLILIGAIFLLHNYGVIHFHWGNIFHLWPIFIVIGGVNLIFANNRTGWAMVIKLGVIILGFALIVFGNFGRHTFFPAYVYSDDDDDDHGKSMITKVSGNSEFNTPFEANAKVVTLNIEGGATSYHLSDTTDQLFSASTREFGGRYEYSHSNEDSLYTLNFKMRGHHGFNLDFDSEKEKGKDSTKTNSATLRLNQKPEWNINLNTGAAEVNFDLSKFKVRSLKIDGGAAEFNVKMGQPLENTNVRVETGMSDVTISVPTTAACHIKSSTGLSSTSYDGFTKVSDNNYETPGFSTAKNKMFIKIDGGLADFKVKRY
ncbi:DUF5668 domain-containing protein [Mucilaginibacter sp. dw_454]|uniref:LiaI-LiaF-like domain-containing protein n=1 Tax=Mucilaginibacter sp. dw_454 TaxID=2720079 RepID=UPI001BD661B0|nr:DUF5668 domain-containing protein [Mucilaginibacter sp. dw_454]